MKISKFLSKTKKVMFPVGIGIILAIVPVIYLQTKKAPQVQAGWFDENWLYRKSVPVTYTGTENLTEYQVLIDALDTATLIANEQLQSDCDDLRFTSSTGTLLPYFIVSNTCNTADTEIFVKTDKIPAQNITFYMYYGNPQAPMGHNEAATFSYSTEKVVAYPLTDEYSTLQIISLAPNNSISHDGNTLSLGMGETGSLTDDNYQPITATDLFNVSSSSSNVNFVNPVSWAGTSFSFVAQTNNGKRMYLMAPWGSAYATIYDDGVAETSCTTPTGTFLVPTSGTLVECTNAEIDGGSNVRIQVQAGNPPILAYFQNANGASQRPLYPNTTEHLYGFAGSTAIINTGGASADVYYIDQAATTETGPTSLAVDDELNVSGSLGFNNPDGPMRVRATNPVAAYQFNDGSGTAATAFVTRREFGTIMGSEDPTTWVAFVSDQQTTCTTYNPDNSVKETETLTSSNGVVFGHPNSGDFGVADVNNYLGAGWYAKCDKPAYAYWQINIDADYDEQNLMTYPMMRQFTYPTPAVGTLGSEEKTPGPAGFWKFDESTDNTCVGGLADNCDSTNGRNDGLVVNASRQSADKCVAGRCLYFNGTTSQVPIYNNLAAPIATWRLNETTGTTAKDDSNNANDLTLNSAAWTTSGKWDGAWNGSGSNWLFRSDEAEFDFTPTDSFTISGWFKTSSTDNGIGIITKDVTGSDYGGYSVVMNSGTINCLVESTNQNAIEPTDGVISTTTYNDNIWHHFACVKNSTSIALYMDGALDTTDNSLEAPTSYHNSHPIVVGGYGITDDGDEFDGQLDDIKIYRTALTSSELTADYVSTYGNSQNINFSKNLNKGFTVETWFKVSSDGENNTGEIFDKGTNTYARVTNEGSDNLGDLEVKVDLSTDAGEIVPNAVTFNKWHHLAVGYTDDGDDEITVYLDGVQIGSSADGDGNATAGSGAPATDGNNLLIGGDTSNNFHGFIDEFKIYPYERTLNQVETDYIKNSSNSGSSVSTGFKPQDFLNQNLVGYWPMDDTSGNATDASGNSITLNNSTSATYTTGKFGNALLTSSSNKYVSASDSNDLSITKSLTISAWINPDSVSGTQTIAGKWDGANESYLLSLSGSAIRFSVNAAANYVQTSSGAIVASRYQLVTASYDAPAQTVKIYVNGIAQNTTTTGTIANSLDDDSGNFSVAAEDSSGTASNYYNGRIDDLRLYSRAFTNNEVADLYAWTPSTTAYSAKPLLTARWKFDEGTGGTAYDSTSNANNLTLGGGASWLKQAKFSGGWDGDGSKYLSRNDDGDFDFTTTDSFTISGWFKRSSTTTQEYILAKEESPGGDGGYRISMEADGDIQCGVDTDNSSFPLDSVTSTAATYDDDAWHYFACVKYGADRMELYIDGLRVATDSALTGTGSYANDDTLTIGDYNGSDDGNEFGGDLDDIHIYRSALSPEQIRTDYNALASSTVGIMGNSEQSQLVSGTPSGSTLRAHWKFDENTSTTINDYSSNTNTLTSANTSWGVGKFGPGLAFNGSTDYAYRNDDSDFDFLAADNFSISAWVRYEGTASANEYILSKSANGTAGGYEIYMDATGDFCFATDDDTSWTPDDSACTTNADFDNGEWHNIIAIKQGTAAIHLYVDGLLVASKVGLTANGNLSNNLILYIGRDNAGTYYWNGAIDDVQIYATALTNDQIAYLANRGKPHAWWKFDECANTTAYDSGLFSMHGTLTPGASGATITGECATSATSMWYNGANGKFNSGLDFDGTDDYVNVADTSTLDTDIAEALDFPNGTDFTISGWFNRDTVTTDDVIVAKRNGVANTDTGYIVYIDDPVGTGEVDADYLILEVSDGSNEYSVTSTSAFISTGWNHFAFVWDDDTAGNIKLYINGKEESGAIKSGTLTSVGSLSNSNPVRFGSESDGGNYFDGKLDDIRIYRYPLTSAQIRLIYNSATVEF